MAAYHIYMTNKKAILILASVTLFSFGLINCSETDITQKVRVRDQGNNGSPRPKPKDWLNPIAMLSVAGLTELQELLFLVSGSTDKIPSCVKVSNSLIEWKCTATTVNPVGRKGVGTIRRTNNVVEISVEETEMNSILLLPSENRQARTAISLVVRNGDKQKHLTFREDLMVVDKTSLRHVYRWEITANLQPDGSLTEVNNRLLLVRLIKRGASWFEKSEEYVLQNTQVVTFGHCARPVGEFDYSGPEQEPIKFVTTAEKGPQVTSSSKSMPWPTCLDQFSGLYMTRNFWLKALPTK